MHMCLKPINNSLISVTDGADLFHEVDGRQCAACRA